MDTITKRYVVCPTCEQHHHDVEHLFEPGERKHFGPWSCRTDDCYTTVRGTCFPNGDVDAVFEESPKKRGFALCKLRDLYLVLREPYGRIENPDYFYHSHQCPTNLLSRVVDVYAPSGEADVHGMIRYVAGIDETPETRDMLCEHGGVNSLSLRKVFELFGTDGEPGETDWPEVDHGVLPFIAEMQREHEEKS